MPREKDQTHERNSPFGRRCDREELGNELNWVDFNGDFALPGQGKSFTLDDLSHDPEAKRVAQGFLQYLKVLAALKDVRDHSRLNRRTPIITAGMATVGGGAWQQKLQLDGVSIPATYAFLRAHGLDQLEWASCATSTGLSRGSTPWPVATCFSG